jgi:hypothetical protein
MLNTSTFNLDKIRAESAFTGLLMEATDRRRFHGWDLQLVA